MRGKRYALKVEDGKVSKAHVEPDNTGSAGEWYPKIVYHVYLLTSNLLVSMAEQVLD